MTELTEEERAAKKERMLGEMPMIPLLVKMAVPAMAGMIIYSLYNLVDTIFLGNFVSSQAIGALGIAFPIQMFAMAQGMLLGIGASSLVSRSLGKGDKDTAAGAVGNAFTLSMIIGGVLMVLGLIFTKELLIIFGSTETLLPLGMEYLRVVLWGTLFTCIGMGGYYLILAEGNSAMAMVCMFLGMIINILLDPLFIVAFKLGIKGAAWATVVGQAASCLFTLIFYLSRKSLIRIRLKNLIIKWTITKDILKMGFAIFTRQASQTLFFIVVNNQLRKHGGDLYISSFSIIFRIIGVILSPITGISQGFQPIAGYNFGAEKWGRVKSGIKYALYGTTIGLIAGFILMMLIPGILVGLFNKEGNLIHIAAPALRIIVLATPLLGIQLVGGSYFFAIGKARESIIINLSRRIFFFIPLVYLFSNFWEINGVWLAFPLSDLLSSLLGVILITGDLKKRHILGKTN